MVTICSHQDFLNFYSTVAYNACQLLSFTKIYVTKTIILRFFQKKMSNYYMVVSFDGEDFVIEDPNRTFFVEQRNFDCQICMDYFFNSSVLALM